MNQERDCNTCGYHKQGEAKFLHIGPCRSCIDLPVSLPNWKGITISKSYDAAFRDEKPHGTVTPMTASEVLRRINPNLPAPQAVFMKQDGMKVTSNGSTASYYELPAGALELQDLISHKDMNAQMGEIFRAVYRFGEVAHSPKIRDIKKIIFYANEELKRLEKLPA